MRLCNRNQKKILMKIVPQLLLLGTTVLMLSSCIAQKLPNHENGYGLIAVPYQVVNATTYQLVKAVELKSSEDDTFSLRINMPPLNDDVVFSKPIPEGSYLVDYSVAVSIPVSGVLERGTKGSENFTDPVRIDLKDGEIVLFPMLYKADQYRKADYVICNISHEKLDPELANYYLEKLPTMENGAEWQVRTAQ